MEKLRVLFVLFFFASSGLWAQVQPEWEARYEGPIPGRNLANAIAVDAQGNCYVTGGSYGVDFNFDFLTIKYDPSGTPLWTARYDGPAHSADYANAIAVDKEGHVYVAGDSYGIMTGSNITTIKYDGDGKELWVARYERPGQGVDTVTALALDGQGNVYVTGSTSDELSRSAFITIKHDSNGKQCWAAQHRGEGTGGYRATALAVDSEGYAYVTGRYDGGSTQIDYATLKYDPEGTLLWAAYYDGPVHGDDLATALAVDPQGYVYVTGYSGSSEIGTYFNYATIKYDPDGNELWVARYTGPLQADDFAVALAVDAQGAVYVTGYSHGVGTGLDYATVKYDADGNQLWVARYDGPAHGHDFATALALDAEGSVYVTGYSPGIGTQEDYATIKYSTEGQLLWVARYDGPAHLDDDARAIAVDKKGYVYVTGYSTGVGTRHDYLTIKYSQK